MKRTYNVNDSKNNTAISMTNNDEEEQHSKQTLSQSSYKNRTYLLSCS
jgi:hypothetical protein